MAKSDFAAGFLQGLYNAGVGNPQVQQQNQNNSLQQAYMKMQMDKEAQDSGMVPVQQDPIHSKIGGFIKSLIYPGSSPTLGTAYQPDPNAQRGYVNPATGDVSATAQPGYVGLNPSEFKKLGISKASQPIYVTQQYDQQGNPIGTIPLGRGEKPAGIVRPQAEDKNISKLKTNQSKEKALLNNALSNFDRMISEAQAIKDHPSLDMATGLTALTGKIPATGAYNFRSRLNTLKSKTGFQVLQEMRANSPTGGALGQVSDRENQLLQENIANLDPNQSSQDVRDALQRTIDYAVGAKQRLQSAYDETYSGIPGSSASKPNPLSPKPKATMRWNSATGKVEPIQ